MSAVASLATLAVVAETEVHRDIGAPPYVFGIGAFAILMLLLIGTLVFGRGRT